MYSLTKIFLIIGGLNWGLIGVGKFFNKDLNFVALFAQFDPRLPAVIYILVGLSAVYMIFKKR